MPKNLQRLLALVRKETTQLLRDRRGLALILGLPLIQLFLYAYAANTTVNHIPLAVFDQSNDRKSREFIQALVNSQYFNVALSSDSETKIVDAIDRGQARAGLIIPPRFAALTDRGSANLLLLLDGSDSSSASAGASAAGLIAQNYAVHLSTEKLRLNGVQTLSTGSAESLPISAALRVLYNPDMVDIWFLLPGLVGLLLQTLAVQQAALTVVRERELGTIEQILITPTRQLELVLSKMIPLLFLCLFAQAIILAIGVFWFGVPFRGSLFLYFWLSLLFIVSCLGLGLLITNRAQTQREASQSSLIFMLLGMLLSGWIYPQSAMPLIPRLIGSLVPMTYFLRISRGIFTKGVGLAFVWQDALVLTIYSLVVIVISARNFKNAWIRPFLEGNGMDKLAIITKGMTKQFKTGKSILTAVDNLSLEVHPGETYGLIGPDGAGKTTTIRVILGLLTRTAGESRILGYDSMKDTFEIRERVGYIAQQNVLPGDLTVLENMRFFAGIQCMSMTDQKRRIPELLAFAGLGDFTSRLAGNLSGGMKKKLALACSLIHEPRVVVLDEPTLGVDPVSRREFWNLLGDLRSQKGLTIFVNTPYMDEAERCNQVGLIYSGKLIATGTPAQIKAMIPGHLLEFTPEFFTPALRLCTKMEGVLEVQIYGEKLHIFVDEVTLRRRQIEKALTADGIQHDEIREIAIRMEEAYISLVRRRANSLQENLPSGPTVQGRGKA